jgi:hypothetical protein
MAPFHLVFGGANQHLVDKMTIFNDFENFDFRLAPGSTGIDNGYDNSAIYSDDISGLGRDSTFDIGAFEAP